jgi:hypothetical protein
VKGVFLNHSASVAFACEAFLCWRKGPGCSVFRQDAAPADFSLFEVLGEAQGGRSIDQASAPKCGRNKLIGHGLAISTVPPWRTDFTISLGLSFVAKALT